MKAALLPNSVFLSTDFFSEFGTRKGEYCSHRGGLQVKGEALQVRGEVLQESQLRAAKKGREGRSKSIHVGASIIGHVIPIPSMGLSAFS